MSATYSPRLVPSPGKVLAIRAQFEEAALEDLCQKARQFAFGCLSDREMADAAVDFVNAHQAHEKAKKESGR